MSSRIALFSCPFSKESISRKEHAGKLIISLVTIKFVNARHDDKMLSSEYTTIMDVQNKKDNLKWSKHNVRILIMIKHYLLIVMHVTLFEGLLV